MSKDPQNLSLGRVKAERKTGDEVFSLGQTPMDFNLGSFWQWSGSDLLGNALRGRLAEFIVGKAIGSDSAVREEWGSYDLVSPTGTKVEVKSSSYLQSWAQKQHSSISFGIKPTLGWSAELNEYEDTKRRQADVYVFCVFKHKSKLSADPMNLDQWDFYVLPTPTLEDNLRNQKQIGLKALLSLKPEHATFEELASAVERAREQF